MILPHHHHEYFKSEFLYKELMKEDDFKTVSTIFALLSDSTRLKIFWFLCHSKECGINIAEIMGITNPAVSHHLKILKEAGLIESYRDGKEVFYTVSGEAKSQALHGIIEKLMAITCPDFDNKHEKINQNSEYLENQVNTIKQIHDYMKENLSTRFTIEELARKFAMNTTTLKTVFKDVYGTSLAAHIKEHRMEKAAELLAGTELPISEIALQVGYESQSKFGAAFKEHFAISPLEYRNSHGRLSWQIFREEKQDYLGGSADKNGL